MTRMPRGPKDETLPGSLVAVKNMYCADCPFVVRKSLEAVPGVTKAVVSYKDKTAVVTFDDGRTDLPALTRATTDAGYPSAPRS
jgi:periplasmic mercuric ion binding protein